MADKSLGEMPPPFLKLSKSAIELLSTYLNQV